MHAFVLRPAVKEDVCFSFAVTEDAMRPYVEATWGTWEECFQRKSHDAGFDCKTHEIVVVAGEEAGILAIDNRASHVQLEKLFLMHRFRRLGVGAALVDKLQAQARAAGKSVNLRILRVNTNAQRFYARHGFIITGSTLERCFMEWHADRGKLGANIEA